ncbi:MAG: hypothetical protein ABIT38_01735 [Gemmatimonadaceae bacterium]
MSSRAVVSNVANASPLARLHVARHRYGTKERDEKLSLLVRIARQPPRSARGVMAYHDDLLFLRAFPDDASVHHAAVQALSHVRHLVHALSQAQRRALDDTGIAGTTSRHTFAFGIAQWLVAEGEDAELDWRRIEAPERLDPLLRLTLTQSEADAFDSGGLSTHEWMTLARGTGNRALAWLVRPSPSRCPSPEGTPDASMVRLLYESLELPLRWRLTTAHATTGNAVGNAVGDAPPAMRSGMRRLPSHVLAHITTPLPDIRRLDSQSATRWVTAARAALSARCREVHAISYANVDEVYLADLGDGTTLCLIGAACNDRLTLEANYGYVIFSNGVPIGYGGVTPLAAQANTGVNIFESFRHSEAPMLYAQALRAFRTLFGVTRFVVNPYQFGAGNDEALASGAFWLYDRLGFRPVNPAIRDVADRERARIAANHDYRSSPATLRRLASSDLVLELPGSEEMPLFEERWLVTLARAVTESLVASDVTSRLQRRDALIAQVADTLGVTEPCRREPALAFGMQRLGPVVALVLDDVRHWSLGDRAQLVDVLAAKGGVEERTFAVASRQHRSLWDALRRICQHRESPRANPAQNAGTDRRIARAAAY